MSCPFQIKLKFFIFSLVIAVALPVSGVYLLSHSIVIINLSDTTRVFEQCVIPKGEGQFNILAFPLDSFLITLYKHKNFEWGITCTLFTMSYIFNKNIVYKICKIFTNA